MGFAILPAHEEVRRAREAADVGICRTQKSEHTPSPRRWRGATPLERGIVDSRVRGNDGIAPAVRCQTGMSDLPSEFPDRCPGHAAVIVGTEGGPTGLG